MKNNAIALVLLAYSILTVATFAQNRSNIKNYYEKLGIESAENQLQNVEGEIPLLKLNDAIMIGLSHSPKLKGYAMEIQKYKASALQTKLYPNPEVGFDLENIFGSGGYGGIGNSESTFFISQNVVINKKLKAGYKVEILKSDVASWQLEKEKLLLISGIRKSFINISSLKHKEKLNKRLLEISLQFQKNLQRRAEAGKVSPAEVVRASLISTSLEIVIRKGEMEIASEIEKLKRILGLTELSFNQVEDICNLEYEIPNFEKLQNLMLNNPGLARYRTEIKSNSAEIIFQKTLAIPDVSLSLGFRRINETKDNVMLIGASIPINIFNDNRGNIQKAQINAKQTKQFYEASILNYEAQLNYLVNNTKAYSVMIEKLENELLPNARKAYEIISNGNMLGRFTVLDVLDAQRSLYELESQFVNAVAEYNLNVVELEELTLTKFKFNNKARIFDNE